MPCLACDRIALIRSGNNPWFVRELRETFCVAHDHQPFRGWCVLLLKDHVEHLHLIDPERQARVWLDVADVARAQVRGLSPPPQRINYECLGNQMAHIHWHVIPRYAEPVDPEPRMAVWVRPAEFLNRPCPDSERDEVVRAMQDAMQ